MKTLLASLLALLLLFVRSEVTRAADPPSAAQVVQQAIKAHGGAETLRTIHRVASKWAGETVTDPKILFVEARQAEYPDRFRIEREEILGDQRLRVLTVVDGAVGWQSVGGAAGELTPARVEELRQDAYIHWLLTLVPLNDAASFSMTVQPETILNDNPVIPLKVTRKGYPEITLYFDGKSHLLVKAAWTSHFAGKPVQRTELYGEYKSFAGVQRPTHIVEYRESKKVAEITTASYRFPARFPEGSFERP